MEIKSTHPFFANTAPMQAFVAPLKKFHIDYFSYSRMSLDGSRVYLSSHPKNLEIYFKQKLYLQGNTEANPLSYQEQCVLWSALPNQHVFQFAKELGVDHGIFFVKPHAQYCEFFAFASTSDHPEVVNYYLNNFDVFQNFILDFKIRAKKLIEEANQNQIVLPYQSKGMSSYKILESEIGKQKNIKLSRRQMDCIPLLIKGATIRQIAESMHISERTVEDHINTLKNKFYANNKTELIVSLTRYFYACD